MGRALTRVMAAVFVLAVILGAAFVLFLLYDTPEAPVRESPQIYILREGPVPYPEEDTMHYITEEGELIIYVQPSEDR